MSQEAWAVRQGEERETERDDSTRRNGHFVRLFLTCICLAEIVILVPNLLTEIAIQRGLYAPILRAVLSVVRLSPLAWPILGKMGRLGARLRNFLEVSLPSIYGPACGGVEPCRGLATALSGWYLISTPMHDAFSRWPQWLQVVAKLSGLGALMKITHASGRAPIAQGTPFDEKLLLPCAVIMSANVGLFLCDALSLTVTPLLRQPENTTQHVPHLPRAETFTAGADEIDSAKFEPTCVICIADFAQGDTLARLPCGHIFHMECVSQWLHQPDAQRPKDRGQGLDELDAQDSTDFRAESALIRDDILSPWLVGVPMNMSSRSLFTESAEPSPLPSSLAVEAVDEEESRVRGAPGFPAGSPQGHMAAEEEAYDEKDASPPLPENALFHHDKGPLVYQESKVFNGETFLINVYDHTKRRAVTFETYGLESQDQLHIQYSYQDFDGLFRFNAELMNPNRKKGRFHWISERLAILIVGKDRQLKLQPEPTSEVPELPIYETKDLAELRAKRAQERKHEGEIMQKREGAWSVREERIRRKNHMWLKAVLEVKAERLRMAKMMQERNQEYLNLLHSLRQPIFEAQLKRMEERKQAAEAIAQSTAEYHEKRAVPKKVKKKGKNALKDEAAKET
eukprot:g7073.t1